MSSKPTAASFSFGQKHKHIARFDTDGPGPSAYDITGLSIKGIVKLINDNKIKYNNKNERKTQSEECTVA